MYARSRTRPDALTPCALLKRCTETTRTETEIVDLVKTRIPRRFGFDAVRDIQVLCPMNRGGARARSLNIELQAALNPAGERKVERFGWTFAPGDKVMHIVNDYGKDVCNGDTGQVADVDPDTGELTARFHRQEHVYGFALTPAYAATVHKSQGSEYPAVVIPMLTQHYAMLRRNLLYTGVTRGKRLVVLVGQSATPPDAGDGPGWTNGCGTWQARGAGPATVPPPGRLLKSCRSPNRALKLTLFALLDRYATMDHLDLDETKSTRPTPSDSTNEFMDAISRRVDGKLVVRTCRATRKGKSSCEFDCPLDDTDQAGEAQTRLRSGDDRPAGRIHRGPRPSEAVH